ncbi:ROK family protein [Xylanibacillus composti]|uniref:Glucokinase n=1 Tax=Xylanibacillus composti TaxID=1572762 RepID=A0A8J4M1F0_9BACL|nr:ROK family glucokinase [Xylanibacillus composti]MDT9725059.1 ROK family protein [Xylanibacillus composti]GIQ67461.1 glucokinase [Xylanibacillus composti]
MDKKVYIGVDLGGTTIKVGACNGEGQLLYKFEGPTGTAEGTERVLQNIADYVRKVASDAGFAWEQVVGVGIGVAGFMDFKEGFMHLSANISALNNVAMGKWLSEELGVPIKFNNDANVAALGEVWGGAGRGFEDVVLYTLGTGVGGGIIINGKIHEGGAGMAGELGHLSIVPDLEAIQCGCGQQGCLETVSSATGIIRMAKDAVERGDRTSLSLLESITAKDVFDAAKAGDEVSLRIINRAAYYLGKSMSLVAVTLNPQRFIVGGGVSKAGDILFDAIREVFEKFTPAKAKENVDIIPAELGNDAGMIGAAGLLLR